MSLIDSKHSLHSRITVILLTIAVVSTVTYLLFIVATVNKLEDSMMATLVGHELDELITDLAADPGTKMPRTASVSAYLQSRAATEPLPEYLEKLSPGYYLEIEYGENTYQVMVVEFNDDRIYVSFLTTEISRNRFILQLMLVGGGLLSTLVLVISGVWLFRKFLFPVSRLAQEVSTIDPNDRDYRLKHKYEEYEVGLIADSIDQFLDRLQEYIDREQSFTAAASHELRTPLSVIASSVDLLELRGVNEEQRAVVDRIKKSSNYMGNVIETLLFFARNSQEEITKTLPEVDLHEIVSGTLESYAELAGRKNLKLLFKGKSRTRARMLRSHFEIILGNLIRNALANTDSGHIKIVLAEDQISIKDTGHGIDPKNIDHIVERNYHGPNSSGIGMGLYLVSKICDIYGMKLVIESVLDKGSIFSIVFPGKILSKPSL